MLNKITILNYGKKEGGFTLLETIFALFVFVIGTAGIFVLLSRLFFTVIYSSSELIAAYLAQEGIEIVRNIRDTNYLMGNSWDENLPIGEWEADYTTLALSNPYNGEILKIDGGFYQYSPGGVETKFKRKISITSKEDINGDEEVDKMDIEVTVEWQERGKIYRIVVKEQLYDWFSR